MYILDFTLRSLTGTKDIKTFLEAINGLDPELVVGSICTYAMNIINLYQANSPQIAWQHLELAAYLALIIGEVNKGPTKGRYAFCVNPTGASPPGEHAPKAPKDLDWSQLPLTPQGQLMVSLIQPNILSFQHPNSVVAMQVFEVAVRYPDFFRVRKECTGVVLEAMVDTR
jgi:exportin-T